MMGVHCKINCPLPFQFFIAMGTRSLVRYLYLIYDFLQLPTIVNCLLQLKYSPRVQSGFGFVDGEDTERLWSYARPFSPILKEMTPSHRVDLLTDLMLHYGKRKKDCLGKSILYMYIRQDYLAFSIPSLSSLAYS